MSNEVDSLSRQLGEAQIREANLWVVIDTLQQALLRAEKILKPEQDMFVISPATRQAMGCRLSDSSLKVARVNRVFKDAGGRVVGVEHTSPASNRPISHGDCSEENVDSVEVM